MNRKLSNSLTGIAFVAYVAGMLLPAFIFKHGKAMFGYEVLAMGWMGIFLLVELRWYSNLLFAYVAIRNCMYKPSHTASLLMLLAVAASWAFPVVMFFNEGSGKPVQSFGLGATLWSIAVVVVGCVNLCIPKAMHPGQHASN